MTPAVITSLCTGIVGVLTAVVALVHSLTQAGILKAHLAAVAESTPPASPPSPMPPMAGGAGP